MKVFKILSFAFVITTISCKKETPLVSGVVKENMNTTIHPGDNFYE
jgi:hypothetical protein